MRKNVLFTVLLLSLMGLQEKVQAQYFSAISPSGHTLYYEVINETNHWVEVTNPNHSYRWDSWTNYSTPYGNVIVPPTVNWNGIDWTVRHIGHDAFFDCQTIQGLTLPEGIDSIKEYALYNINIDTLVIPSTVTFIGQGLFNCPRMHYLTIPASVQQIAHEWGEGGSILGINVAEGNPYYRSIDGCLVRQTNDIVELMVFPRARFQNVDSVVIPEGVTKIDFPVQEGIYKHKLIVPSTMTYLRLSNDNENGYAYDTIVFHGMMPPALIDNNGTIGYVQRFELPCGARRSYSVTAWGQYADRFFTNNYLTQREYSHTIAYGESYPWGDNTLTERGVYEDTLLSVVEGCDSLHRVLTLNVVQHYRDDITLNAQLPAYNYHGLNVDKPGIYEVTVSSEGDFDSLFILRASAEVNSTVATVALGGIFDGQSFNLPAMENRQLVRGVDTITVTNIHQIYYDTVDVTIAEGSSYYGHTLAGVYQDTIYAADYDSVVRSRVSMNVNRPLDNSLVDMMVGDDELWIDLDSYTLLESNTLDVAPDATRRLGMLQTTGTNLIANGDFEQGNTGFSTTYIWRESKDNLHSGTYGIGAACIPFENDNHYAYFFYHRGDTGYYYGVNATVEPHTWYLLSYKGIGVDGGWESPTRNSTRLYCNGNVMADDKFVYRDEDNNEAVFSNDKTILHLLYSGEASEMELTMWQEAGEDAFMFGIDDVVLTPIAVVDTITIANLHGMVRDTINITIAEGENYRGYTLAGIYQDTVLGIDADSIIRSRISMTVNRPLDSCTVQLGGNQGGTYFAGDEFYTAGTEISVEPSKSKTLQYTPDVLGENLLPFYSMEENDCFSNYQSQYIGDYLTAPNAGVEIWGDRGVDNSPCMMFGYSTAPDQAFFRTSLSTKVGEKYNLSFMASSSHNDIAIFVLKVNGILTTQTDTLVCCNQAGLRYFEHIIEATSDVTTIELINVQMEPGPYGIGWYIDNMSLTKVYSPTEDTITITNTHGMVYDTVDVSISEGESYRGYTLAGVYQDTVLGTDADSIIRSRISMTVNRPVDNCTVQLGGNQGGTYFAGDEFYTVGTEISVEPSKSKTLQYTSDVLGENLLELSDMEEGNYVGIYRTLYAGDYLTAPLAEIEGFEDRGVNNSRGLWFRGTTDPGKAFFRTILPTSAGEKYYFHFNAANGHPSYAVLALKVNGEIRYPADTLINGIDNYYDMGYIIEATSDTTTIELENLQIVLDPYLGPGMYEIEWYIDNMSLTKVYSPTADSITITNTHGLVRDTVDVTIVEGENYRGHTLAGVYCDTIFGADIDSIFYARVSTDINHTFGAGTVSVATNQEGRLWMGLDDEVLTTEQGFSVQLQPTEERRYVLTSMADGSNLEPCGDFENDICNMGNYIQGNIPFQGSLYYTPCDTCGHTGKGVAVKGSVVENKVVYRTNYIGLPAEHRYSFSYWAKSHTANNPALLVLKINGDYYLEDTVNLADAVGEWMHYEHIFTVRHTYYELSYVGIVDVNLSENGNEFFLDDISLVDLTEAEDAHRDTITLRNTHEVQYATVDVTLNEGESYNGHTLAGVYNDTLVMANHDSITRSRISYVINHPVGEGITSLATSDGLWIDLDSNSFFTEDSLSVDPMQTRTFGLLVPASDTNLIVNGDFELGDTGFTSHYSYGFLFGPPYDVGRYIINEGDVNQYILALNNWPYQDALYVTTANVTPNTWYKLSYRGESSVLRGDVSNHPYGNDNTVVVNGEQIGNDSLTYSTYSIYMDMTQGETFTHYFYNSEGTTVSIELNSNYEGDYYFAYDDITLTPLTVSDTITITNRHQLVYDTLRADICQGDVYTVDSVDYSIAGTYTLDTRYYADSTVYPTLILAVHDNYYPQLEEAICEGESYAFGGDSLTVTDVYVDSLTTVWGCDSIVTLNLTVHAHTASVQNEDVCDSYFWTVNNTRLVTGGQYIDTISNVHGCDSVCTLNLTVRYSTTGDTSATACDRFSWYGHTYTASGMPTHTLTLTNAVGCDSTLTLHLTVNRSTSGSETFTVCDSLTWHDSLYTVSGTYQDILSNRVGCDSVVTLYLTVNSTYQHTDAVFACDNQLPYMYHEQPLNTAGDHAVHFQSVAGCDSTVTVTLTVGATYQHSDQLALCQSGMPYTYGDRTFLEDDTTGVYTIPFSSVEGCDSIISLDLTVHESEATEIYVVTVQATNNLVLWQPAAAVESYRIYRESSTSGIYSLMAEVPYDEGGSWLDTESDARQHSYRYRMTSVDSCGVESEQSPIHRTMHLTINQGVGNSWNLVWTEYQGTTYSTYRIFRGTSYDNMQMIGEIPSDNTTFTDNNAPEGYVYYQIVVLLSAPGAKDASNEIRSNVATNDQTGIGSVAEGYLNVYQQNGDIVVETVQGQPLQVYDLSGRKLFDVISTGVDRFEVPVTGVYLIRVEGMKTHRIVVEK